MEKLLQRSVLTVTLLGSLVAPAESASSAPSRISAVPYVTAEGTASRLSPSPALEFTDRPQVLESEPTVFVDARKTFQSFVGIGGALTDASAETFSKLSPEVQTEFLQAYFDPQKGIGYTLARTTIASSDFSSGSYGYVKDNDTDLKTFSVSHDEKDRIPFIKRALAATQGKLTIFASPWSPPAWMKDNGSLYQGGKLKPEYRQSWANFYVAFIHAYEAHGIPIWGLTVQNEPMAKQRWESCIFTAEDERDFIRDYLGPTLKHQKLSSKKLIAWDHNRDLIYQRARTLLNDPKAAQYIWGIGYHWYETWSGGGMQFDNLKRVAEAYPQTNLIFTEGCKEAFDFNKLDDWTLGERYGISMVNDFNAGAVGWTDWNVLLDEKGGPNHVGNFCFAPVHADTRDGKLHYTNAYYYIGHFSKFIRSGAKRIITSSNRDSLQTTGFLNSDGSVVIIILNTTEKKLDYQLWSEGRVAPTQSLPHSITTVVMK